MLIAQKTALVKTTVVEGKLLLREPMSVIFGILFPTAILLGLGAVPVLREPSAEYGGARFVEGWAPTALVMGLAVLGLQHLPGVVATYRENGVLRRMSATPVHPATVLIAQLIVVLAAVVAATGLLVVTAWLILDVSLPRHPLGFAAAIIVGFAAVLAIGMLIAAVAPNARVANGLAGTTTPGPRPGPGQRQPGRGPPIRTGPRPAGARDRIAPRRPQRPGVALGRRNRR